MDNNHKTDHKRGFSLVVTLTLMVLLSILALGMLSLATIELRSTSKYAALAQARSNARLALQIAIGKLQSNAGPDQRITATSDILAAGSTVPTRMTGVWKSKKLDPSDPASLHQDKSSQFLTWLTSNADEAATDVPTFTTPLDPISLFTESTLGTGSEPILAGKVPVTSAQKSFGHYAYTVQDEGVKARINLSPSSTPDNAIASSAIVLGSGQNPGIDRIKAAGSYLTEPGDLSRIPKIVSLNQGDIAFGTTPGTVNTKFTDLTAHSLGLLVDVANGGFKKDLNLLAENPSPPAEYAGRSIYSSSLGLNIPSDHLWDQALGFARIFNDSSVIASDNGMPVLQATAPQDWNALKNNGANDSPPSGPVLLPSIAKVQVVFSLAARDMYAGHAQGTTPPPNQVRPGKHGPWYAIFNGKRHSGNDPVTGASLSNTDYDPPRPPSSFVYLLHLLYSPIVTLHNPYNIPIEFPSLQVDFRNVPFRMQILRNGEEQMKDMLTFQRMSAGVAFAGKIDKRFGMTLKNSLSTNEPIRLQPGETKVFSTETPNMHSLKFLDGAWQSAYWDINNKNGQLQENLTATPGWRGEQYGMDMDWLQGASQIPGGANEIENGFSYNRMGTIPLRASDTVQAQFAPLPDDSLNDRTSIPKFSVEITLPGANSDAAARTSVIEFDYTAPTANDYTGLLTQLKKTWSTSAANDGYLTSPSWNAFSEMNDHYSVTMANQTKVKAIALFSAYAKTTHGGVDSSNADGSYAGKPWMFNNFTGPVSYQRVGDEAQNHFSVQPYEINFEALPGDTQNAIEVGNDRGNFITGHTSFNGLKFGTLHGIPVAPIQSPVSLNAANLGSSYYVPTFNSPIGNSYAHPGLATSAITSSSGGADHSYLLNSIFFESYFCSGIQTNSSALGNGRTAEEISDNFLESQIPSPLPDQALIPYFADGSTLDSAKQKLESDTAYLEAGAHMLRKGAFNVNSVSKDAWKAMLSSLSPSEAKVITSSFSGTSITDFNATEPSKGATFSRFRIPNASGSNSRESYWQGTASLTEGQLDSLADNIVLQVKARGPFLSMTEFVNRHVGSSSEETQKGALQAAIDDAQINDANTTSQDAGYEINQTKVSQYNIPNPDALSGNSAQGAPGFLTQADLLSVLGNAVTVRSDTFVIRTYGDATDADGNILATAYCEAVVQRYPEYVDTSEPAATQPPTKQTNINMGRRFAIRSIKWLNPDEI